MARPSTDARRLPTRLALVSAAFLLALAGVIAAPASRGSAAPAPQREVTFTLTVLHNNDAESQLIDAGTGFEEYGGIARFAAKVRELRVEGNDLGGVVMLSSGDNYLAGPEFNASLEKGVPFYDSIALDRIHYDAMAVGNHEFDFGPDVFARFIRGFEDPPEWISANLNVSGEPKLDKLVDEGIIAKRTIVNKDGHRIGIVGATTPMLPFITSPRNVTVRAAIAKSVQKQVDALTAEGVQIIILISHLQSIDEDLALAPMLSGVDIMIAGGGDELLANPDDVLVPGDEAIVYGAYPLTAADGDGVDVPIITTSGDYRYIGKLVAGFDDRGNLVMVDELASGPVRVTSTVNADGVEPGQFLQTNVVDPLTAAIAALDANIVATSEVALDGQRAPGVRTIETNEGNLIADSMLAQATQLADAYGVAPPDIALQNGGGIRNNSVIPAGDISELDTFSMVPFANFVAVVPNVSPEDLKTILENAVSRVELSDGRFAQIAGFTMTWDAAGTPMVIDDTGAITQVGSRIVEVTLDDGTPIIEAGAVVVGAPSVSIATIDFLARGGDQYPFDGAPFTTLGVTYQQALRNFLTEDWGLAGVITALDYPEGGEGRITRLN